MELEMQNIENLGTVITTDVLVLGAGGAGMCAAIKARENGANVLLIDKCGIGWNGQVPIGGGILAYVHPEYAEKWAEKVTRDSFYFNNQDWTLAFGKAMHKSTLDLAQMGVNFLKNKAGNIDILNWGPNIYVTLFEAPKSLIALKKYALSRGVKMMDKIFAIDLLKRDGRVNGAVGLGLVDGITYIFNAKTVIIATGNCGYMHEKTYSSVLGEGPAMGYRAGAQLVNAEFNSNYVWGVKVLGKEMMGIHFYLYLENARGEKIMGKHYPELMVGEHSVYTFDPRVINAMQKEVQAGLGPIYMNLTGLTMDEINNLSENRVGGLMANDTMKLLIEKAGIDPQKEKMEMWPRYLYSGGGLRIDIHGKTSLDGLYAAGGASNNSWTGGGGSQGGLGVQSAAVTGFTAGENAAREALETGLTEIDYTAAKEVIERVLAPTKNPGKIDASVVTYRVHEAIVPMKYNRQREASRMKEALGILSEARDQLKQVAVEDFHDLARYHSAESMCMAAEFTLRSALMRTESRASHFREDFPQRDDKNWFKWIVIQQQEGAPGLSTVPVPLEKFKFKPDN
jgi:succinate dehydrogenase / fumarate reductase flavoprotein subunit